MLRIENEQARDEASLHLDAAARRELARVLADWLNVYAGMASTVLRRDSFGLVVESRRLLLSPDEQGAKPSRNGASKDCEVQEISVVSGTPPEVDLSEGPQTVYLTFEGLPGSRTVADNLTRIRVAMPAAHAAELCRRLGGPP